jgi:cellulose synthase/poly-beta-1,6-N-acetylglucosamine synthase-like glycosyltransferase
MENPPVKGRELPESQHAFQPSCCIVVCTRNRPDQLGRCLKAVAGLSYPHFDVLVVDNAPIDNRAREVAERWNARYLIEPQIGLSRARNLGAINCDADIVAYIDDDSVPQSDWLSNLVIEFRNPQVMGAVGKIESMSRQSESQKLWAVLGFSDFTYSHLVVDKQTPYWFAIANFGRLGGGANMAIRRSVFSEWAGFDERLGKGAVFGAGEEHNAFFRLIDRGYRVTYAPRAIVVHPSPTSMPDLKKRYLNVLKNGAAYATLLFFEEKPYRRDLLKYLGDAIRGRPKSWRSPAQAQPQRIVSRWRMLLARTSGCFLYCRWWICRPYYGTAYRERTRAAIMPPPATTRASSSSEKAVTRKRSAVS